MNAVKTIRDWPTAWLSIVLLAAVPAWGQDVLPDEEASAFTQAAQKLKALKNPDAKTKRERDHNHPPFEFIRTQVRRSKS